MKIKVHPYENIFSPIRISICVSACYERCDLKWLTRTAVTAFLGFLSFYMSILLCCIFDQCLLNGLRYLFHKKYQAEFHYQINH